MSFNARIAYFSMEIGLTSAMPTYAGGLGVLAGDTIRAAADIGLPMVAVSLSPFESLLVPLAQFRVLAQMYARRAYPALQWLEIDRHAILQGCDIAKDSIRSAQQTHALFGGV